MDASARSKAEMAQKIAQELLKSSGHRMGMTSQHMPALNSEQSNIVRAAQQKAAEIAIQASPLHPPVCIAPCGAFLLQTHWHAADICGSTEQPSCLTCVMSLLVCSQAAHGTA